MYRHARSLWSINTSSRNGKVKRCSDSRLEGESESNVKPTPFLLDILCKLHIYDIYTKLRWANGRACITRSRTRINVCTLTKIKKQQYYKIYLIIYENVTRESFSFSQLCEWLNGSDSGCCCCCHFSINHNFPEQNESKHLHRQTHAHTQRQRTKKKEWPNEIMISKSLVLVYRVCNLWKPWIWKPGLRSYTYSRKGLI